MTTYELKHIRGVPYYLDGTTIRIFNLDNGKPSSNCVAIGTYVAADDTIAYFPDWRERVKSTIESFRNSLAIQERDKLRESIVKPQKPRKATRTSLAKRAARNKDTESE
jgi:hypothetical protein